MAAAIGLLVNTLAVLGVAWRGGRLLGRMETSLETQTKNTGDLTNELRLSRVASVEQAEILARMVAQVDAIEQRVGRLERQHDGHGSRT